MENVPSDASSDKQPCPGGTLPVPHEGSGQDGSDPRWDMKVQEDPFYTQELRPPTDIKSVPTSVKSRH